MLIRTTRMCLWALIATGAASACTRLEQGERHAAAPCFAAIPTLDSLHALAFDAVFGAADSQFVDFAGRHLGQGTRRGSIEPEIDAWSGGVRRALKEGRGCIIARIGTEERVPGPPFSGATHAYWWVQGDPDSSAGRSVFIPDDATGTARDTTPLAFRRHPGHRWFQALSRFKQGSLLGWSVCGDMCCESPLE